ncbi:MAG TPA: hypothetical protein VMC02_15865 [Steroidobacteraceae bacterium]|nr:hypothetical protein [Steroidobacteraceae bacterium]
MNDSELTGTWAALEPTAAQRRRIEARVRGWLDARESSLAAEWLRLIRINPIEGLGIAALAGCLVLIVTPLGWVVSSIL